MSARPLAAAAALVVLALVSVASSQLPPPTASPGVEAPPPAQGTPPAAPAPAPVSEPGDPAPPEIVTELERALAEAIQRFQRMDLEGVLANVSDRYRSGPLTKPVVRQQLLAMFTAHDTLRARVHVDAVRMIGDRAWVYSTGEVTGRLRWLGTPISVLAWERAPEVAWREGGRWRLIGDQQN